MLLINPCGIERRRKCPDSRLAERRGCVPAKQFAQSFELQHSLGVVDERLGHRNLCYRKGRTGGVAGGRSEGDIGREKGPLWAENKPLRSADELRLCSRCLRYIPHRNRQTQNEDGATLRFILAGNLPMMLLHYSVHCAQSQAGAFADRLGGIKGIENSIRLFYSWPTIGKLHYHFSTVDLSADPEQSSASIFQCVQRVLNDLDECLE